MRDRRRLAYWLAQPGLLFWGLACCNSYSATIQGSVTNANGEPVARAAVEVINPYQAQAGLIQYVWSDVNGRFKREGLPPGDYMVFASKPDAGYGDTRSAMFAVGLKVPEIKIHELEEIVDVTVNIGSRGAFLTASVVSMLDSSPVPRALVKIALEAAPDKFMSFGVDQQGSFHILVPARPIIVTISAPGYDDQAVPLSLSEDEHKAISIALKKPSG